MRLVPSLVLAAGLLGGCDCGASHAIDGGFVNDLGLPEADAGIDSGRDAGIPPLPPGACEAVFSGGGEFACGPETVAHCGVERCCRLMAECVDGLLAPGTVGCAADPVTPDCGLDAPNARITIVVDGESHNLEYGYADHGVGFDTHADLTFTTDGRADVCTTRRLGISFLPPDFEAEDGPAYNGVHEVQFQWSDDSGVAPRYRFFNGTVTITSSLPFRSGGPLEGALEADAEGIVLRGSFIAAECEEWRTSGS